MLPGRNETKIGPANCYTLRRKTASIIKDSILLAVFPTMKNMLSLFLYIIFLCIHFTLQLMKDLEILPIRG